MATKPTIINGVVFVGPDDANKSRDNVIRIELAEDGVALHAKYTPAPTLTRFKLTVGDTTIDSSVSGQEAAFSYDVDTSILTLDLSKYLPAQADPNTKTAATLTVYSADWPDGVVWLHSSGTPDKLNIKVLAVA
ncbi:MAG: hypothetical protein H6974_11000 [Gammaproteobacteria bacterium]|nr:hypothetical protein [Gammaproteobacteria bacterium]